MNKFLAVLIVLFFSQLTGCASTVAKSTVFEVATPEFSSICDREMFEFRQPKNQRKRAIISFAATLGALIIKEK